MLELDAVSFCYPGAIQPALDHINLRVSAGECLGLLGPNGAGKTTLLSLLCGLRTPTDGRLRLELSGTPGIVPQQLAFYPQLSVHENLQLFADLHRLRGTQRRERLAWAIERCALQEHQQRRADSLSGGEQRRLNFAIGVLQPTGLYLFDEATVGVDARSRQLLLEAVQALTEAGHAVIYTSHYLDEVERVAQRIVLLDRGQVRVDLNLSQLLGENHGLLMKWPGQLPAGLEALLTNLQLPYRQHAEGWYIEQLSAEQLAHISAFIATQPALPSLLRFGRPSLEQLYLHLSGGGL